MKTLTESNTLRSRIHIEAEPTESYEAWRDKFIVERLSVLYIVGLIANPAFSILDYLAHSYALRELTLIRIVLEIALLTGFALVRLQTKSIPPPALLAFWILFPNMLIVHMTLLTGGFASQYYNGLSLVWLAAGVIVPMSWRAHLTAQIGTLFYYYTVNWTAAPGTVDRAAMIQHPFFLVWYCVAIIIAVTLYERLQRAEFDARQSERAARVELEASHRQLVELDHLKDQFFANISHELRTPLTVSLGAFKSLLKRALPPESIGLVHSGLRNTSRLLYLINELLELARFESGRADVRKVCVDVVELVKNVAANFESSERQRIVIEGANVPIPLEVDVRKMMKVIYNLLANAFKFSDPDRGMVWIRLTYDESHVEIAIQDNGIGIPVKDLDRIFERFTQVEGDTQRRYEGSGIGLALAKEIVMLHQGQISVQSTVGTGSTFTVTLPRSAVRDVMPLEEDDTLVLPPPLPITSGPTEVLVKSSENNGRRPDVLIVDDNTDMRNYLVRLLAGEYQVISASNGAEALTLVQQRRPMLVLADIMMPVMTGHDLLREIRKNEALRQIPVILLTARAGTEAHVESLAAGADDYVSKPFHEEELLARIKTQLRTRALYDRLEAANAELREMNLRKSEFVSIVSHDLRTPLAAIGGFVDNLLSEIAGPLSAKQRQYLQRIQVNIDRSVRMINDLLDLARIEAGTIDFLPKPISLTSFIDAVVENLQYVARQKGIDLRSEVMLADQVIHADADKLTQVLTNLIHNACKFTPAGGQVRIEATETTDHYVQICVSDTGCGIPEDQIARVFDKFYSRKSPSTEGSGTGLGLAIAKHFVDLHQGRIWVESQEQAGSRFFFTVPILAEGV